MQSKTRFFANSSSSSKHFSLDAFDGFFRSIVLQAHAKKAASVADARFYLAIHGLDLETTVKILLSIENSELLSAPVRDAIFFPVGCGDTANALCKMMTGNEMNSFNNPSIASTAKLTQELENNLPKLIRIDLSGHSYVILACEESTEGVLGYVYQSNVAYGMEDNSFSLAAWLNDRKSQKTNVSHHLQKLNQLLNPLVSQIEKDAIYRELYFANPIVPIKIPANLQEIIADINKNPFIKHEAREVNVKYMSRKLKTLMQIQKQSEEQPQSLDDYILQMRRELAEEQESGPPELEYS